MASSRLPIKISRLRFNVEARPFAQEIGGKATCTIPAGKTSCEAPETFDMALGTRATIGSFTSFAASAIPFCGLSNGL